MPNSRDSILQAIRLRLPESTPLPGYDGPWVTYPDVWEQFMAIQKGIGGQTIRVSSRAAIANELEQLPLYVAAQKVLSLIPEVGRRDIEWDTVTEPHQLEDVDVALLPAEFAVAENAALWVTDLQVKHRVIYFLCQHLILVVPASAIVHNMHEAYERVTFDTPYFGTFLAGPSKTADIEQSLVIGAHGPKSLTVFVIDNE